MCPGGCFPGEAVSVWGKGVCLEGSAQGGGVCLEGVCQGGVCLPSGVCLPRG